jgi:hypothetical protein
MVTAIIDPTAGLRTEAAALPADAARPDGFSGLRIGLLENTKHNADHILSALGDALAERHDVGALVHRTKPVFAMPLPEDLVEELIRECDVVVIGVGDCGSCSASAVADGIALERVGIPTAVICTDAFIAPSKAMAGLKGAPEYPFVLTPHPIANLADEAILARGRELAGQVEARLVRSAAVAGSRS